MPGPHLDPGASTSNKMAVGKQAKTFIKNMTLVL